jgi:hypothetical protein
MRPTWDEWLSFCYVNRKHECWPARTEKTSFGGRTGKHRRVRGEGIHRISFRMFHGYEPDTVDHLCERMDCANPYHLDDVTSVENTRRHYMRRREDKCPKGHEWTPENTYVRKSGTRKCRTCHRERQAVARRGTNTD